MMVQFIEPDLLFPAASPGQEAVEGRQVEEASISDTASYYPAPQSNSFQIQLLLSSVTALSPSDSRVGLNRILIAPKLWSTSDLNPRPMAQLYLDLIPPTLAAVTAKLQ